MESLELLRDQLTKVFPRQGDWRRIARDTRVASAHIKFEDCAINVWSSILEALKNPDRLDRFREVIINQKFDAVDLLDNYIKDVRNLSPDPNTRGTSLSKPPISADEINLANLAIETAHITAWALEEFESLPGERISSLITDPQVKSADRPPKDQKTAYDDILSSIAIGTPPMISLGGISGVGKSTALRWAAKKLAKQFLNNRSMNKRPPLPIIINLGRVRGYDADPTKSDADIGEIIINWWINYANKEQKAYQISIGEPDYRWEFSVRELVELSKHFNIVVFLDAVDEFLSHFPKFEETDLIKWLSETLELSSPGSSQRPSSGLRLRQTIVARKTGLLGGGLIDQHSELDLLINPLSEETASRMLPRGAWKKITSSLDETALQLFRTPFFISVFSRLPSRRLRNILRFSPHLQTYFEGVSLVPAPPGALIELAFLNHIASLSANPYSREEIRAIWETSSAIAYILFLKNTRELSQERLISEIERRLGAVRAGWLDLLNVLVDGGLLHRRNSDEEVKFIGFSHKIWADFCLTRQVANLLMDRNFESLGNRTFPSETWRDVGYHLILSDFEFTGDFFKIAYDTKSQFLYGILGALVCYAPVKIQPSSMDAIEELLGDMPQLATLAIVSAFCGRANSDWSYDPYSGTIKTAVVRWCEKIIHGKFHAILVSVAQCYLADVGRGETNAYVDSEMSDMMRNSYPFSHGIENGQAIDIRSQSKLERVFLEVFNRSFLDSPRLMAGVHYGFLAATCYFEGENKRIETRTELRNFLTRQDELKQRIERSYSDFTRARLFAMIDYMTNLLKREEGSSMP